MAHLIRKAQGLEESFVPQAQRFGAHILPVIATVIEALYRARGGAPPDRGRRARYAPMRNDLLDACLRLADSPQEKTRALARELLNDWGKMV